MEPIQSRSNQSASSGPFHSIREKSPTARYLSYGPGAISATAAHAQDCYGQGKLVAVMDTGVFGTHAYLSDNYSGPDGFKSFYGETSNVPTDPNGHGTHCAGIAVGKSDLGVAPGAMWMAGRVCDVDGKCSTTAMASCCDWLTCAGAPEGTPCKVPDVLTCSIGGIDFLSIVGSSDPFMAECLKYLRAVGTFSVFAIGNCQPGLLPNEPHCVQASYPGSSKSAFGVGCTNQADKVCSFSCEGSPSDPILGQTAKPNVYAPGENIVSAWNTATTALRTLSGTSMSTPHVAGAAAVVMSAIPGPYTVDDVERFLCKGSDPKCGPCALLSASCGCGRINVGRSLELVKAEYGSLKCGSTTSLIAHETGQ